MKKDCRDCYWYWLNNDTEYECDGQEEICEEFTEERCE